MRKEYNYDTDPDPNIQLLADDWLCPLSRVFRLRIDHDAVFKLVGEAHD